METIWNLIRMYRKYFRLLYKEIVCNLVEHRYDSKDCPSLSVKNSLSFLDCFLIRVINMSNVHLARVSMHSKIHFFHMSKNMSKNPCKWTLTQTLFVPWLQGSFVLCALLSLICYLDTTGDTSTKVRN